MLKKSLSNLKKIIIILALICLIIPNLSYGIEPRELDSQNPDSGIMLISEEPVTTSENENSTEKIVQSDLFFCQETVDINYDVSGNVFIIAQQATISGTVDGNVFALAETLNVKDTAYVSGDIFVCAEKVNIDGYILNLYCAANTLNITKSAQIIKDIKVTCSTLNLSGTINRDVFLACEKLNIDGETAKVLGDFEYTSSTVVAIPENIVAGNVKFELEEEEAITTAVIVKSYLSRLIKTMVISIIVILAIILGTPKFANKTEEILSKKAAPTLGFGVLALLLIPIICFILIFTIIGIPASLALIAIYIFIATISSAIVSIPLGKIVCNKLNKNTNMAYILVSILLVLILWILEQTSIIGGIISFFTFAFALGIIVYAIFKRGTMKNNTNVVAQAEVTIEKDGE